MGLSPASRSKVSGSGTNEEQDDILDQQQPAMRIAE
jgi:hypothetical protein